MVGVVLHSNSCKQIDYVLFQFMKEGFHAARS